MKGTWIVVAGLGLVGIAYYFYTKKKANVISVTQAAPQAQSPILSILSASAPFLNQAVSAATQGDGGSDPFDTGDDGDGGDD